MPRIADDILNCVIYVYPTLELAQKRENAGGSGFVIGTQSKEDKGIWYVYVVTNAHVVNGNDSYITVNRRDGGFDIIFIESNSWKHHPNGDDLVMASISNLDGERHQLDYFVPEKQLVDEEILASHNIGIGDDVFIVGRFQVADGKLQNTPTLRFGNIAQMPNEPVESPHGIKQESFLVECHSISGFSGSPVFIRIDGMSARPNINSITTQTYQYLLGVDWGHKVI